jgi:hypothetical protein
MALDFPNNPTNGQFFNTGGVLYLWDGTKWTVTTGSGTSGASAIIAPTAPTGARPGSFWYNTTSSKLNMLLADGVTWVVV